jgi:signal transduction histidine kinase/DNA-binding response OmpR family regulator
MIFHKRLNSKWFLTLFIAVVIVVYIQIGQLLNDIFITPINTALSLSYLPIWISDWALFFGILGLIAGSLYVFHHYLHLRRIQKTEALRQKELEDIRASIFSDLSNGLRTPLTVILGMAKQVRANPKEWYSEGMELIERNSQRLVRLVSQMIDLSKLKAGMMRSYFINGDVVEFLRYVLEPLQPLAANKNITLTFEAEVEAFIMQYDMEKLWEVVHNLVSNAIKFTPEGGSVNVTFAEGETVNSIGIGTPPNRAVKIRVHDTGRGIPAEQLPHVFDRNHEIGNEPLPQIANTPIFVNGIGLALTKELVKFLGGDISVKSEVGKWTEFEVTLPVVEQSNDGAGINLHWPYLPAVMEAAPGMVIRKTDSQAASKKEQREAVILIVESNADMAQYLQSLLSNDYHIEVAEDGRDSMEKALEFIPDIIILDVMIPDIDGYILCEAFKKDERTGHIPIIMLTADTDMETHLKCLKSKADAFFAKPFYHEELALQIKNLVSGRKTLQQHYSNWAGKLLPGNLGASHADDDFTKELTKVLEEQYANENFDITELCHILHMSRTQCYRKISSATGVPAAQLLRKFRLKKAKDLLMTSDLSVSQIALEVGYKDLGHFSRSFHQEFGINPSEIKKWDK